METIQIVIHTNNAAFDDTPAAEIARILHELARAFSEDGLPPAILRDANGNTCGAVRITSKILAALGAAE